MKIRDCKRGCGYPALKGRQFCYWHALMRMSSDEQATAAADRRENQLGHDFAVFQAKVAREKWPPGERWCAGCQSFVPLFYCTGTRCKACASKASYEKRLEKTYGISPETYQAIWKAQGERCAICRNKPRTIRFAVDHDHQTGEVRGILCKRCNHDLLGGGHDDVATLWRAISYLLAPPARRSGREPSRERVWEALQARLDLRDQLAAPRPLSDDPAPF